MPTRNLCHATIVHLVNCGSVPGFKDSGQCLIPEGEQIHYNELLGPLYGDPTKWQFVYQLMKSFTKCRDEETWLHLPELFGRIPLNVGDFLAQLPSVFSRYGFECVDRNEVAQSVMFRSTDSCEVKRLPEPFGKWLQHQLRELAWNRIEELEVTVDCRLRPVDGGTFLDMNASTLILPLIRSVADDLNRLLSLKDELLGCPLDYVRYHARFQLAGKPVSLEQLSSPRFLEGLYRGERRQFADGHPLGGIECCEYFRFFPDGCVMHTINSYDFFQVATWLWKGTDSPRVGVGNYRFDGRHVAFYIGPHPRRIDYQGSFEHDILHLRRSHSVTRTQESGTFRRVTEK